jgi:hypothetical protein
MSDLPGMFLAIRYRSDYYSDPMGSRNFGVHA